MSYLGNTPTQQNFVAGADQFSGTGSQTAFTLSRVVNTVFDIFVTVSNVPQDPFTAYTVAGNTLTFDGAPPSGTNNIDVVYRATNVQTFVPSPGVSQQFAIGTAASPAITFVGDTNTGIFSPAADTIAFTEGGVEAMRIDSASNVGIGTTTPVSNSARLSVRANGDYEAGLAIGSNASVSNWARLDFKNTNAASPAILYQDQSGTLTLRTDGAYPIAFNTNGANERARINSGGYFKTANDGAYNDASGNYCEFLNTNNNQVMRLVASNASYTSIGVQLIVARNTTNNTFYAIEYFNSGASAAKFRVADSGNVTNTNGSYGTTSDVKLKQDIVDASSQWSDIKSLRFRKYRWKSEVADNPDAPAYLGLIAQEAKEISPGLVEEHIDRDAEGNDLGTTTKSVKTSILYMKAVKALQEAMTRIETLEAEVQALKGNA